MADEVRPDWDAMREKFIGLDESFSVKSYYPQLKARLGELEESRTYLEQKSAALIKLLEDLEDERKKVKESEARLHAIFSNLPFAFWSADAKGIVQLANETARSRYGMEAGAALDSLPVSEEIQRLLDTDYGAASAGHVVRNERALPGSLGAGWIQAIVAPIVMDGAVSGVLGADVDISKLKAAEDSLAALNEELESKVFDRTQQLEGKIAELRDAQERLILSEKLAALGRLTAGIAHELNSPLGAIESSSSALIENVLQSTSLLSSLFINLPNGALGAYFSLLSDSMDFATKLGEGGDRKRRREFSKHLASLGAEKPEYLAELVDEINGYAAFDALADRFGVENASTMIGAAAGGASLARAATIIRHAAERAALVVQALKNLEAFDTPDTEMPAPSAGLQCEDSDHSLWTQVDIDRTLASSVELYRNKLRHGVQLVLNLESHATVCANAASLNQVWINMITNALQAMDYRGDLEISSRREAEFVVVRIIDTGCGIPDAVKDRVFDPFFTTKPVGEGTGFGLVVAKRFVERSGGTIDFESRPGRTEFRVRLPASDFPGVSS